jgi:hypothetical protein
MVDGYVIRHELQGQEHDEAGQEILVFERREERWRVIRRMQHRPHRMLPGATVGT